MTQAPRPRVSPYTLPNILTYGRIVAVPLVVLCLFPPSPPVIRWLGFAVFAAAAITDYFDGYLARAWGQQSSLGRMLDPIADKLLVSSCLLMLGADGTIQSWSLWAAIVILCREVLVSGLREFLAELRVSVPVTRLAKWKTTVQLLAVGLLIAGPASKDWLPWLTGFGLILLWVSAIVTLYTGYDYFRSGVRHLIEE